MATLDFAGKPSSRVANFDPDPTLRGGGKYGISRKGRLLVHGDNLQAMRSLMPNIQGKVKLIYIDPPYNTGRKFNHYNDKFKRDDYLAFLLPRFELMRGCLSDDGLLFVSIDKEVAYLQVLLDSIFGEANHLTTIIWKKTCATQNTGVFFTRQYESILVYAKDRTKCTLYPPEGATEWYTKCDKDGRAYLLRDFCLAPGYKATPQQWYSLKSPSGNTVWPYKMLQGERVKCGWLWGKDTLAKRLDRLVWAKKNGKEHPFAKYYADERKPSLIKSLWLEEATTHKAFYELRALNLHSLFETPKPEGLIKRIIELSTKEGDLVMDCFAGSGTTCAVAHKLNRRYIGIELGTAFDKVLLPRMKKVVDGEQGGISDAVNWRGGYGFNTCIVE